MKPIMLINVKMPTIVGILTFISMITTEYESLKAKFQHFSCYEFILLNPGLSFSKNCVDLDQLASDPL